MFNKIGNKLSNWKRRAKNKININKIKDKDSAFEAIGDYGLKLYDAINKLGISGNCTKLTNENEEELFKLFKTEGCDLCILAKALPIIKTSYNYTKFDVGMINEVFFRKKTGNFNKIVNTLKIIFFL